MNSHKDGTMAITAPPRVSGRPDPDGPLGDKQQQQQQQRPRPPRWVNWNILFVGFLAMAATACGLSVLTGTLVLPSTHVEHRMDHSENHPSFEAMKLRRNRDANSRNKAHMAEFENSYRRHRREAIERYVRDHPAKPNEAQHHEPEARETDSSQVYHMVFSTSCSPFQNWQALAFFYFARKVRQPGTVTRLVSGCTDEQTAALRKVHTERVVPMALEGVQTFEMHVTPNFDDSKGGDQKYFNKPNGLLHWMQNSLGFKNDGSAHAEDDSIIIIVDPDMMLLRPITKDFSSINYRAGWVDTPNTRQHVKDGDAPVDYGNDVVTHGRPHAQKYGYGKSWIDALGKENAIEVVGPDSPALEVSPDDARDYYPAGPPYVATARDMYQIAVHWVKFLPRYHDFFNGMMCEMHSYSLAAAHLKLPHKLATAFMVSDYESDENFGFIDEKMTLASSCMDPPRLEPAGVPLDPTDSRTATDPAYERLGLPVRDLPFVLHYCQRYALGRYFFSKYKLREDVFDSCEAPMMIEPPRDVAVVYDWNMFPNGIEHWDYVHDPDVSEWANQNKPLYRKRNGWFLCTVIFGVNEAIAAYKRASCGTNETYFRKTWHFHEEEAFRKSIEDPSNPFQKQKKEKQRQQQQKEQQQQQQR